jgi:hypothetical protein
VESPGRGAGWGGGRKNEEGDMREMMNKIIGDWDEGKIEKCI